MRLKQAARFFDTCPVYDAYSGIPLFKIQASTFLESSAEGSTASRRVISLAPELQVPEHGCLLILGQIWVVGTGNIDEWEGSPIRKAHWTKLVTDSFKLLTPAQAALNQAGTSVFGSRKFLNNTINSVTDAEYDPVWDVSLSKSVQAPRGFFLKSANTLYRIRMEYTDLDGFLTCQSDEVDEPVTTITLANNQVYDPVKDTYTSTVLTTSAVLLDYTKVYSKQALTDIAFEAGDLYVVIAKQSAQVSVGKEFTIQSGRYKGNWRVLGVRQEYDSNAIHARRA